MNNKKNDVQQNVVNREEPGFYLTGKELAAFIDKLGLPEDLRNVLADLIRLHSLVVGREGFRRGYDAAVEVFFSAGTTAEEPGRVEDVAEPAL